MLLKKTFLQYPMRLYGLILIMMGICTQPAYAHTDMELQINHISQWLEHHPGDIETLFTRADKYRRLASYDEALKDLNTIEFLSPVHHRIMLDRARIYFAMGEMDKTVQLLEQYLLTYQKICKNGPLVLRQERKIACWRAYWVKGQAYYATGRPLSALKDLDDALLISSSIELYLLRGRIFEEAGQKKEAIDNYRDALRFTGHVAIRLKLIALLKENQEYSEALQLIAKPLKQSRNPSLWLLRRARIYEASNQSNLGKKDLSDALVYAHKAVLKRRSAMNLKIRGEIHLARRDYERAVSDFEAAARLSPRLSHIHTLLAKARKTLNAQYTGEVRP